MDCPQGIDLLKNLPIKILNRYNFPSIEYLNRTLNISLNKEFRKLNQSILQLLEDFSMLYFESIDSTSIQSLNNFNAYYLPGVEKDIIYDGMTPVNTFRTIFNAYFNQEFEILEDRHFWVSSDREPYKFIEVTDIINEFE